MLMGLFGNKFNMFENRYLPHHDDCICLWYIPSINRFIDDDGTILHSTSHILPLWITEQWKKTKQDGVEMSYNGIAVELHYLEDEIEEDLISHSINISEEEKDAWYRWAYKDDY